MGSKMKASGRSIPLGLLIGIPVVTSAFGFYSLYSGNEMGFGPSLRVLCVLLKPIIKMDISFDQAAGSFKTGELAFDGLHIKRQGHQKLDFDLHLKKCKITYSEALTDWSDPKKKLREEIKVEQLAISGMKGHINLKQKKETPLNFWFKDLQLKEILVDIIDSRTGIPKQKLLGMKETPMKNEDVIFPPLEIKEFSSRMLRTPKLIPDLLFNSHLNGSIGGGKFSIQNKRDGPHWFADSLPVDIIRGYLSPPMSWIDKATLDIDVGVNPEVPVGPMEFGLHMDIKLRNIKATPNDEDSLPVHYRATGLAVAEYLNSHEWEIPLNFNVVVREDQLGLGILVKNIGDELVRKAMKDGQDRVVEYGRKGIESMINLVDIIRKK